MREKKAENNFLYFLEGVACISVIFIHSMFPSTAGVVICGLARFAVPLFFLVSGYYLWDESSNSDQREQRLKQKISHTVKMLTIAVVIYLCWTLFREYLSGRTMAMRKMLYNLITPKQIFAMLFLNDFTIIGGHLWFLAALLYCYLFIFIIRTGELSDNVVVPGILLPLGIHIVGRMLFCLFGVNHIAGIPVYIWFRNWMFMALPFFFAGNRIRSHQKKLMSLSSKLNLRLIFWIGVLLTAAETIGVYRTTSDDRELYIGTILMVYAMFTYALQHPEKNGVHWLKNIGKRYLAFIYITHLAVAEGLHIILAVIQIDHMAAIQYLAPIMTAGFSLLGAVLWEKLRNGLRIQKRRKTYG